MILLDTHVLLWLLLDDSRLGDQTRQVIYTAWAESEVAVSAITFWEVAMLHEKRRLSLLADIDSWRASLLESGLTEIGVDGRLGIRAAELEDFHADPADRVIVATALEGHRLVTADRRILGWSGNLDRLDARE
jgi:PIN domain nuclease of toxin-antitoxin system